MKKRACLQVNNYKGKEFKAKGIFGGMVEELEINLNLR